MFISTFNPIAACIICKQDFVQRNSMTRVCSLKCSAKVGSQKRKEAVADKRATKAKLEAMKPRNKLIAEAQTEVNRYARLRDIKAGYGCITCGESYVGRYGGAFDAGHMHSRGSRPHLRFNLGNIALQCVRCNRYRGGQAHEFRLAMGLRRGHAHVEALEAIQGPAKWSREYLIRLKRVFAKKARRMEARIE